MLSVRANRRDGEEVERSGFSEEQIAYALRLADSGTFVVDVCRPIGVSEPTHYTLRTEFGDFGVTELKRLKMLESENARLKRILADPALDTKIQHEVDQECSEDYQPA